MFRQRPVERIHDWQQFLDKILYSAVPFVLLFALDTLAIILKVRLPAYQRIEQIVFFGLKDFDLFGYRVCHRFTGWIAGCRSARRRNALFLTSISVRCIVSFCNQV